MLIDSDVPEKAAKKSQAGAKKAGAKKAGAKKAGAKKAGAKKAGAKKAGAKKASAKKAGAKKATKKAASSTVTAAKKVAKKTCFVVMPFGPPFDAYYERIYKPAIEQAGLLPQRADDLYRSSTIVNDIWAFTQGARLILADLTGRNPNVFYELGLAHAIAKPAVLVAEKIADVPFDLRSLRILLYNKDDPSWGNDLQAAIAKSIEEVLAAPNEAVLPTFLTVKPERAKVSVHERELLDLKRELDLLKMSLTGVGTTGLRQRGLFDLDDTAPSITPSVAIRVMRNLIAEGRADPYIMRELTARGVPSYWIRETLMDLRKTHRVPGAVETTAPSPEQETSERGADRPSAKPDKTP